MRGVGVDVCVSSKRGVEWTLLCFNNRNIDRNTPLGVSSSTILCIFWILEHICVGAGVCFSFVCVWVYVRERVCVREKVRVCERACKCVCVSVCASICVWLLVRVGHEIWGSNVRKS